MEGSNLVGEGQYSAPASAHDGDSCLSKEQGAAGTPELATAPKYTFTNLEGQEFTVEELVAMERSKDERFRKASRPPAACSFLQMHYFVSYSHTHT